MAGEKIFIGPKLRELRQTDGLTQADLARALGVSPSYVNLVERNQRSASLKFLISLADNFGINWRDLTNSDSAMLLGELREVTRDPAFGDKPPDVEELRSALEGSPNLVRGMLNIFNAYRSFGERLAEQNEAMSDSMNASFSIEHGVHDFFRRNNNHFPALEECAEKFWAQGISDRHEMYGVLKSHLKDRLNIDVRQERAELLGISLRYYNRDKKQILLSDGLDHNNRVFQLAHMIALIEFPDLLGEQLSGKLRSSERMEARCRVELANYFAAALMMPYSDFFKEAVQTKYDIDRLSALFSVSYEQICHRLTTLQKPGQKGIPFFFLRVDRAGNISKRFNVTPIQLARYGGACPRLDIHYCFRVPGRIMTQIVEMPDNSRYLTINRTVDRPTTKYSTEDKRLAVSLGCSIEYSQETIYGITIDPKATRMVTEIGVNCRLCPRQQCEQRAHDPFYSNLPLDENRRGATHFES